MWIDTHCHLDAPEFASDRDAVRVQARRNGVMHCVVPAVEPANWAAVEALAHAEGDSYALGIHPLYTPRVSSADWGALEQRLAMRLSDPRLVAVGEIGLDFFVPGLDASWQRQCLDVQLSLAQAHGLPVILHVRRSVDALLGALRRVTRQTGHRWSGIAHAFNGSLQQAHAFLDLGFCLGFGGAVTFERSLQLRRLVCDLPLSALVLETDAPDIPPHWLYRTAEQRQLGQAQGRNTPAELPRIGEVVAALRGMPVQVLAQASCDNACRVLPRLGALLTGVAS